MIENIRGEDFDITYHSKVWLPLVSAPWPSLAADSTDRIDGGFWAMASRKWKLMEEI